MDWLQFIAAMTASLAWPFALIVLFLLVRRPLLARVPDLEILEWKDFRFRFGRRVHELAAQARRELVDADAGTPLTLEGEDHRLQLAEISPRAAILEAWIELEVAAMNALRRRGVAVTRQELQQPARLADALINADLLDASQADLLSQLRRLRNAAAHASDPKITVDTAREFVGTVAAFERLIAARTDLAMAAQGGD
ncbi:hypothetical protein DWG18_11250 [Lysobacter sp. TY2-98]|uniref:hypothetical protein n=1 Tax=Lysobacter sp. TY2-98 TaxID=2290922 RepID=UPI000E20BE11|nr:hypothetical protein [Lysobacter sp. TY2-98]AXK72797.1 hypothetical protein DWG18_11250 [Lysobacter sp. TY2-98]